MKFIQNIISKSIEEGPKGSPIGTTMRYERRSIIP
nr:MAG TPA: hypothetical protein [Caudoviricetes sp.]